MNETTKQLIVTLYQKFDEKHSHHFDTVFGRAIRYKLKYGVVPLIMHPDGPKVPTFFSFFFVVKEERYFCFDCKGREIPFLLIEEQHMGMASDLTRLLGEWKYYKEVEENCSWWINNSKSHVLVEGKVKEEIDKDGLTSRESSWSRNDVLHNKRGGNGIFTSSASNSDVMAGKEIRLQNRFAKHMHALKQEVEELKQQSLAEGNVKTIQLPQGSTYETLICGKQADKETAWMFKRVATLYALLGVRPMISDNKSSQRQGTKRALSAQTHEDIKNKDALTAIDRTNEFLLRLLVMWKEATNSTFFFSSIKTKSRDDEFMEKYFDSISPDDFFFYKFWTTNL